MSNFPNPAPQTNLRPFDAIRKPAGQLMVVLIFIAHINVFAIVFFLMHICQCRILFLFFSVLLACFCGVFPSLFGTAFKCIN